jgi:glycerol-3-phosphate acyltransferase PlsY
MKLIVLAVLSYVLGSVPFGLLVAKAKGVNIREVGSGNIGATNVFRSIGKGPGVFTFFCDFLKGFVPAFFFAKWSGNATFGLLFGMMAILGHNFPVFLKFKGGKGIATSAGMLAGVAPAAVLWGIGAWLIIFLASGFVSLASIIAALVIALVSWLIPTYGTVTSIVLTVLAGLAIYRHKTNILRLRKGEENRFNVWKKK